MKKEKEWIRLQRCIDLGNCLAVYALLSSWPKSELDALGQEVSDAGEFAIIEWAKLSLKPENFEDKALIQSLDRTLRSFQEMLFEISAILAHYQKQYAQSN